MFRPVNVLIVYTVNTNSAMSTLKDASSIPRETNDASCNRTKCRQREKAALLCEQLERLKLVQEAIAAQRRIASL